MLTKYINNAMAKAAYDKLEDGSFSGKYGGPQKLDNVLSSESPTLKGVNHEQ